MFVRLVSFYLKKCSRYHLLKPLGYENGSVLLIVMLVLSLMTVIGLSMSKTSIIEMRISNNQTIYKQNFYQTEAAIGEGMQELEETDLYANPPGWMQPLGSPILTTGVAGTELVDVYSDLIWNNPANSQPSASFPAAQMMSAYRGVVPGGSLDLGASTIHAYDVYGRSRQNNGLAIIKMAYRKAF